MKSAIERYRELAGIVESRPAYMGVLTEETETREMLEARVGNLTETGLLAEIDSLIAEREQLAIQLKAEGLFEHYHELKQTPELDPKTARLKAIRKSKVAKSHTIHKRLGGLKQPRQPGASFVWNHQDSPETGGLQRGHTHKTPVSDNNREDRQRRMHAHAAFHHFHAAQAYKALGSAKKAERHLNAAEAHHKRAKAPEGSQGDYMVHHKTGKWTDYTPVYDKKGEKTRKNKVSKAARVAKKKVAASENPDTRAATADKERKPWKVHGTEAA
jgi:hypothetical protein